MHVWLDASSSMAWVFRRRLWVALIGQLPRSNLGGEAKRVRTRFGLTEVTRRNVRPKSEKILHELVAQSFRGGSRLYQCRSGDDCPKAVLGG